VFLRIAENSTVKLISPDLANTAVQLVKGRAMIEVLGIHNENNIRIDQDDVSTQVLKNGLYDFDAEDHQIRVFKDTGLEHTRLRRRLVRNAFIKLHHCRRRTAFSSSLRFNREHPIQVSYCPRI